jgi:hypothetical protein
MATGVDHAARRLGYLAAAVVATAVIAATSATTIGVLERHRHHLHSMFI